MTKEEKKAIERLWDKFKPRLTSMSDDIREYQVIHRRYIEDNKVESDAAFWKILEEGAEVKDLGGKVSAPKRLIDLAPYLNRIAALNKNIKKGFKGLTGSQPLTTAMTIEKIRGLLG